VYKPAYSLEKCYSILTEGRGTQFDPRVVDAFFARRDEIVRVQIDLADMD
jgi:putative two-component system response regulator